MRGEPDDFGGQGLYRDESGVLRPFVEGSGPRPKSLGAAGVGDNGWGQGSFGAPSDPEEAGDTLADGTDKPEAEKPEAEKPEAEKPGPEKPGPEKPSPAPKPDTSALNQQVVQAVTFTNTENSDSRDDMVVTPPEMMTGQATGLAVQGAESYMNAIMQIAVAAQAVAAKQIAQTDGAKGVTTMNDMNTMVQNAVSIYSTVSTDAGKSSKDVFGDLQSG